MDGQVIKIGRNTESDICIEDDLLSRIHCSILYNVKSSSWLLLDGFLESEKETDNRKYSTNGTWVYLKDNTEIHDGFIFKANQAVLRVHLK